MIKEIKKAKFYKRFLASLIDYALALLAGLGIFVLINQGIIPLGFNDSELRNTQLTLKEDSYLFDIKYNDEGNLIKEEMLTFNENDSNECLKFNEVLNNYYYEYLTKENKSNRDLNIVFFKFDISTLDSSIFKINDIDDPISEFKLKDTIFDVSSNKEVNISDSLNYNKAIKNYYMDEISGIYYYAINNFENENPYKEISSKLMNNINLELTIGLVFSTFIFIGIPSLIFKHNESIIMHLFKLGYVNHKGYKISILSKIARVIFLVALIGSSMYAYFIPILINVLLSYFDKEEGKSLIDILSYEVCIDISDFKIYKNEEEYIKANYSKDEKTTSAEN